jgi:lipase chaperone LimK
VFDYFLSAIGEEDLTSIISRIRAYIRHKLADQSSRSSRTNFRFLFGVP